MIRTTLIALAVAAVSLGATASEACEHACACAGGNPAAAKKKAAPKAATATKDTRPVEEKVAPAPAPAADDKLKQGAIDPRLPVDQVLAAKCSCSGPGDCTCKKGECSCPKCGGHRRMIDSLKGSTEPQRVPGNARRDASAGVFI
jgi:hypothetical protein